MRQEGRFRERVRFEGAWHDTVAFGLLRSEWRARGLATEGGGP